MSAFLALSKFADDSDNEEADEQKEESAAAPLSATEKAAKKAAKKERTNDLRALAFGGGGKTSKKKKGGVAAAAASIGEAPTPSASPSIAAAEDVERRQREQIAFETQLADALRQSLLVAQAAQPHPLLQSPLAANNPKGKPQSQSLQQFHAPAAAAPPVRTAGAASSKQKVATVDAVEKQVQAELRKTIMREQIMAERNNNNRSEDAAASSSASAAAPRLRYDDLMHAFGSAQIELTRLRAENDSLRSSEASLRARAEKAESAAGPAGLALVDSVAVLNATCSEFGNEVARLHMELERSKSRIRELEATVLHDSHHHRGEEMEHLQQHAHATGSHGGGSSTETPLSYGVRPPPGLAHAGGGGKNRGAGATH